jgi:hypothetical protein
MIKVTGIPRIDVQDGRRDSRRLLSFWQEVGARYGSGPGTPPTVLLPAPLGLFHYKGRARLLH